MSANHDNDTNSETKEADHVATEKKSDTTPAKVKTKKKIKTAGVSMGPNAGTELVDSIFGRDRELESTEKLMNSIRLWNTRFDANCEDILRRPSVAKLKVSRTVAREVAAKASNESKEAAEDDAVILEE